MKPQQLLNCYDKNELLIMSAYLAYKMIKTRQPVPPLLEASPPSLPCMGQCPMVLLLWGWSHLHAWQTKA